MIVALIAKWVLAAIFISVVMTTIISFSVLTPDQKRKYKWLFISSIILSGIGTIIQISQIAIPT
jgi:xanthine/uracil permease